MASVEAVPTMWLLSVGLGLLAVVLKWVGWALWQAVGGWLHVSATAEHPQPFSVAAVVGVLPFSLGVVGVGEQMAMHPLTFACHPSTLQHVALQLCALPHHVLAD